VVKSPSDGVQVYGALRALGEANGEVVFTSLFDDAYGGDTDAGLGPPAPADWTTLMSKPGGQILLDHAIVRYGGGGGVAQGVVGSTGGDLDIRGSQVESARQFGVWVTGGALSIRDSVISGTTKAGSSNGYGLYLSASGVVAPVISGTQFVNNGSSAGRLQLASVTLDASRITGNAAVGNGGNGLWLGATFAGDSVLTDAGIPYVNNVSGLTVNAGVVLTVEKGTVVKSQDYGITVNGTLRATGQDGDEVIFTGLNDDSYGGVTNSGAGTPTVGEWGTLLTNTGGQILLEHAVARYGGAGGGGVLGSSGGDLEISDSSVENGCQWGVKSLGGSLAIRDSAIRGTTKCGGAYGDGLHRAGGGLDLPITHTEVISNAGWGLRLYDLGAGSLLEGNDIVGNGEGGVQLTRGSPGMFRNLIRGNPTGVYCAIDSQPLIGGAWHNGNDIYSNTVSFGVQNPGTITVTATYNWWGSDTGPTHAGNPGGTGDAVTNWVDYRPWLGFSTRPPTPVLEIAPTVYDFGPVDVYSTSPDYTFTVTNSGSGAWNTDAATITGVGAANFQLAGGTCASSSLVPISTCTSMVRFAPITGGHFTVTLTLPGSGTGGITMTAQLRGTGIAKVFLPLVLRGY
jgi:hypothetical protein